MAACTSKARQSHFAPSPRCRAAPSSDKEDAEGQEGLVEAVAHKSSDNEDVDEQGEEELGEEEGEAHAEVEDSYRCTRHGYVLSIILGSDRSESEAL